MAGSRQHLTSSCMRAYLRCLTLVDTDVLLYVPAAVVIMVLLYCSWLWCCYNCCPNEETEGTKKMKNK